MRSSLSSPTMSLMSASTVLPTSLLYTGCLHPYRHVPALGLWTCCPPCLDPPSQIPTQLACAPPSGFILMLLLHWRLPWLLTWNLTCLLSTPRTQYSLSCFIFILHTFQQLIIYIITHLSYHTDCTVIHPYPQGIHSETPQWNSETVDSTKSWTYYVFPIHTYL